MLRRFVGLLAETWILDLAAGIALGLAFLGFVQSIFNALIQFWTMKRPDETGSILDVFSGAFGGLAFEVDGRPIYLAEIVESALTLLTVAGVVVLLVRMLRTIDVAE